MANYEKYQTVKVVEKKTEERGRKKVIRKGLKVTVNHELDKYNDIVLAPEKVETAEKSLSKLDLTIFRNLVSKK